MGISARMGDAGRGRALTAALFFLLPLPFLLSWPVPFSIAFTAITVWLVATAMAIVRRPMMQNALVSLASVSFCVVASEVFTFVLNNAGPQVTDTLEYSMDDPDLGYRPRPNQHAHARETYGHRLLFEVSYTIDANGFRPVPTPATAAQCRVVFFGDSLMFGWGLPDNETLPAQFVSASGRRYHAYNLAYNGYGPHQMLRLLETGRFDRVVGGDPVDLVIYQGLVAHVARAAGNANWDLRGPRYVRERGGERVTYVGPFHGDAYVAFMRQLKKSEIYSYLSTRFKNDLPAVADLPLYVAILKQTKMEVERRYGPGSFIVLFWYDEEELGIDPAPQFEEAGLNVIPIERIVPDIYENNQAYEIAPVDPHPNAAANRRIAEFLAREVGPPHCRAASVGKAARSN